MKKVISIIITAMLMLSYAVLSASAEEAFAVSDFLYADFETPETSGSVIFSAEKNWVAEGFGGSRGAVKMKNNANNMGGVAFKQEYRSIVGETYEISIMGKPPADNPNALDNCYAVAYYRYLKDGNPAPDFSGYHLIYLTTKEEMGGGWYRYSASYTVSETCTLYTGGHNTSQTLYGDTCTFEYRAKNTNIEYMLDEFVCKPAYSISSDEPIVLNANFDFSNPEYTLFSKTAVTVKNNGGANQTAKYAYVESNHQHSSMKYSNLAVMPATAYKLTWYAKIGKAEDAGKYYLRGYIDFTDADKSEIAWYQKINVDKPLTEEWQKFECVFRPSKNSQNYVVNSLSVRPSFYFRMSGQGDGYTEVIADYCVDELKIERLNVPFGGSFDGGFAAKAVYDGANQVQAWTAGSGAVAADQTEEQNAFIQVTQVANSGENGRIAQNIYLKPNTDYCLSFRAKSESAGAVLTPSVSIYDGTQETVNALTTVQLQEGWTEYQIPFSLASVPSTCLLGLSLLNGENTEEMVYCIDEIKVAEKGLKNASVSGDFSCGSIVTASVDNDTGAAVEYRLMTSTDGVHFARLSGGVLNGSAVSYTISDRPRNASCTATPVTIQHPLSDSP